MNDLNTDSITLHLWVAFSLILFSTGHWICASAAVGMSTIMAFIIKESK